MDDKNFKVEVTGLVIESEGNEVLLSPETTAK